MAKTNIIFNNKNYQIDSTSLDSATSALRTHLSTVMNGSGTTINLGDTVYNIDSAKLATARNAFVSHLNTIAGSGSKVVVNGVEYGIGTDKVAGAISALQTDFDALSALPSVDDLQNQYEFVYFSTLTNAVNAVNDGTINNEIDVTKESAVAGVYIDKNNCANVVLLKDNTETTKVPVYVDMIINLGGHTLDSDAACPLDIYSGNVVIDGRIKGSAINAYSDTASVRAIQARTGSLKIMGGTYTAKTTTQSIGVATIQTAANLMISDAKFIAIGHSNATRGISIQGNIVSDFKNCNIEVTGVGGYNQGVLVAQKAYGATTTLSNCTITSYANYNMEGSSESSSVGIKNYGTLMLNNCTITGTHTAVDTSGAIYVNGGTYESYGHGGIYFATTTTSYVRNATLRCCDMPDGYTAISAGNGSAFYMNPNGYNGDAGSGTQRVYMDKCYLYGITRVIAMADSDNNELYISNSTINQVDNSVTKIRIDGLSHKLYIGVGNNFTADDTNLAEAVIMTNETYIQK